MLQSPRGDSVSKHPGVLSQQALFERFCAGQGWVLMKALTAQGILFSEIVQLRLGKILASRRLSSVTM